MFHMGYGQFATGLFATKIRQSGQFATKIRESGQFATTIIWV